MRGEQVGEDREEGNRRRSVRATVEIVERNRFMKRSAKSRGAFLATGLADRKIIGGIVC